LCETSAKTERLGTHVSFSAGAVEEQALQEYVRAFKIPGTIRAMLADYRAASTIDFEHDEEDLGKNVQCPLQALWGEFGKMHDIYDVLATWQEKATTVTGRTLKSGHFIPEEAPDELIEELNKFL
jgi:haloacetate dehalogenase